MKKPNTMEWLFNIVPKFDLKMKLTFLFLIVIFFQLKANSGYSQYARVSLNLSQSNLAEVMEAIESKTEFKFFYKNEDVELGRLITLKVNNKRIHTILDKIFENEPITYEIYDKHIVIKREIPSSKSDIESVPITKLSQGPVVTGVVFDENGLPLLGANVLEKGTTNGTQTDFDGNFTLSVADEKVTLMVSYLGYSSQEIALEGKNYLEVVLLPNTSELNEVVVIGYGTQKVKEITSAVTSIKADEFNTGNITNPAQLLQGKVAGLSITNPGSDPNGGVSIRLRGLSTLGANTGPLIVVDGVPGVSLLSIDPNDIESMDVLKDGSAAAIYGTRGSSGVVLVTTKGGKAGQTTLEYNTYVSLENVARKPSVMSASEFVSVGGTDHGSETDWFDEITRAAATHVHNLSLSGGNGGTTYRASLNYRDAEGIAINTGFEQLIARVNLTHRGLNDRLRVSLNLTRQIRKEQKGNVAAFQFATVYNPTAPVYGGPEADRFGGYWQEILFGYYNPVAVLEQNTNDQERKASLINIDADFKLAEGLKIGARYSREDLSWLDGSYYRSDSFFNGFSTNGNASRRITDNETSLFETTLSYNKDFEDFGLDAVAGYSYQEFSNENFSASGGDFITDELLYNNLGLSQDFKSGVGNVGSYKDASKLIGSFARLSMNYKDAYFLSASIRREGSTKFGDNNKWGNFPGIGAGIDLSELLDSPGINQLKLRGSYGITGAVPSGNYLSLLRFNSGNNFFYNGEFIPAFQPSSNPNPDLKWEKKEELDFGVDFALFNSKLTGSVDYYDRRTTDGIINLPVPVPPNLYQDKWLNVGEIKNSGVEVTLDYDMNIGKKFFYSPTFTFSTYNTELVTLSGGDLTFGDNGVQKLAILGAPGQNINLIRVEEGSELGQFIGWEFDGVNDDGTWRFRDQNDDGVVDTNDEVVIGNGLPDYEIGFNNSFKIGKFDINAFFRGSFGHDLINTFRAFYEAQSVSSSYNVTKTKYYIPELTDRAIFSDYHVEDASFFRLQNLDVGFNFDVSGFNALKGLRLYATGQNLFTITGYTGVDPEVRYADNGNVLAPGIDRRNTWFTSTTITLGLNAKF